MYRDGFSQRRFIGAGALPAGVRVCGVESVSAA
jgi:hypothetical protein